MANGLMINGQVSGLSFGFSLVSSFLVLHGFSEKCYVDDTNTISRQLWRHENRSKWPTIATQSLSYEPFA
jgi:hypothetical protein